MDNFLIRLCARETAMAVLEALAHRAFNTTPVVVTHRNAVEVQLHCWDGDHCYTAHDPEHAAFGVLCSVSASLGPSFLRAYLTSRACTR